MNRSGSAPLSALDRAIELARDEPWTRLIGCAAPGLALTWLCLLVYYFEWVEGVRALRPAFALAFVLAYCARALLLARFAGRLVDRLLVPVGGLPRHAPPLLPLRIALLLGTELWLWLWLPVLALRIDILLLPLSLPLLALRGGFLPSWLAACDGAPEPNTLTALREAFRAAEGRRGTGMIAELFLLVGALILALNLGALTAALISVSQDVLGLPLSFARAFISPRNHFALILLAGLSLSVLEPLRAALSAVLYAEYRLAQEAIEVRALVERCVARGRAAGLAALCLVLLLGAEARAQDDLSDWSPGHDSLSAADECDDSCREARARDDALLVEVVSILDRDEFRDFPDRRWATGDGQQVSVAHWLERFLAWLFPKDGSQASRAPLRTQASVPLRWGVLVAALLALCLASLAYLALRRRRPRAAKSSRAEAALDAASAPSRTGEARPSARDARAELCALYLMSLRGLAARGLLTLASHATNGAYLRALRPARERAQLSELTRLFEHTRYGAALPSDPELRRARELCSGLCGEGPP